MSGVCYNDLKREAERLLRVFPFLPQSVAERNLKKLFNACPIAGPLATAHLLKQLSAKDPKNPFWPEQIEACKYAVRITHKLKKANAAWARK